MVRGCCHSLPPEFRSRKWPTSFVALPRVGDLVQCEEGVALEVIVVKHMQRTINDTTRRLVQREASPHIEAFCSGRMFCGGKLVEPHVVVLLGKP